MSFLRRMKKPVIGLDLDECLGKMNATVARFYNKTHGKNLTEEDFHSHKYWEVWGGSAEEASLIVKQFFKDEMFIKGLPVVDGSFEALTILNKKFDIYIITSRHLDIEDLTKKWIDHNFPGLIKGILMGNLWSDVGVQLTKEEMVRKIDADVFIDDNWEYVRQCETIVKIPILFGVYGWNRRSNADDYKGMMCCRNWEEVVNVLMNISFDFCFCYIFQSPIASHN